jgi:short-subunit dehydrogenase
MELDGAHVLITGGSRGIGAQLAHDFHAGGARVTIVGRSEPALRAVAAPLNASVVIADLSDAGRRRTLIGEVEAAAGPIDVLVNNAGWEAIGALVAITPEDIEGLYGLNAIAPALLARQVLPGMIDRGRGHIVNISSLAGCGVLPGMGLYSATKSSLTHLTAALRAELRGLPIGTTVVEVGLVKPTSMADRALEYPPTARAFRRFYRLGLLADTNITKLSPAIVSAVTANRRHVRRPRRAVMFSLLPEAPRRMAEWILTGVRPREG